MGLIIIISLCLLSPISFVGQTPEKAYKINANDSIPRLIHATPAFDSSVTINLSNVVMLNQQEAISLLGKKAKDTSTYVATIKSGKRTYCSFFRTEPGAFNQFTPSAESDKMIESILVGEPLAAHTDSKYLFLVTDQNFRGFEAIDQKAMRLGSKRYILVITDERPKKVIKATNKNTGINN